MLEDIAATPVSELSVREPVRVASTARLHDVVVQLREHRRGAALVEEEGGRLVGIFTERDLMLRVNHDDLSWHDTPVTAVMTANPTTVTSNTTLARALDIMQSSSFRHLPVVASDGRAQVVISVRDILAHIVDYFPEEFLNLPPDPEREMSGRWGG